jgi:hypothetical protein
VPSLSAEDRAPLCHYVLRALDPPPIKWALYCLTQPVVAGVDVVIVDVGYSAPKRDGIYRKQVAGNDNSVTGLPIIQSRRVCKLPLLLVLMLLLLLFSWFSPCSSHSWPFLFRGCPLLYLPVGCSTACTCSFLLRENSYSSTGPFGSLWSPSRYCARYASQHSCLDTALICGCRPRTCGYRWSRTQHVHSCLHLR